MNKKNKIDEDKLMKAMEFYGFSNNDNSFMALHDMEVEILPERRVNLHKIVGIEEPTLVPFLMIGPFSGRGWAKHTARICGGVAELSYQGLWINQLTDVLHALGHNTAKGPVRYGCRNYLAQTNRLSHLDELVERGLMNRQKIVEEGVTKFFVYSLTRECIKILHVDSI